MTEATTRLGVPLLVPGQGQKDVTMNEALLALDSLVGAVVQRRDLVTPPADPVAGACWLVPEGAGGEWDGESGKLAAWTAGGWRFYTVPEGMSLFVMDDGEALRRTATGWAGVAPKAAPAPSVADATGGAVVDVEARLAVNLVLERLRSLGLVAV
jgi:hypothetical protein